MRPTQVLPSVGIVSVLFLLLPARVSAQASVPPNQPGQVRRLITEPIDETKLTRIAGSTHPLARAEFDQGAAPGSLPTNRILLVLKRSAEQEAALEQLVEEQQDKSSPNYHKWLTPEEFGQQFGLANDDLQTITSWLQSHGFTVSRVAKGRTVIEFSGTAGQVRDAFRTEIHKYSVNGEDHWANSTDPQIPSALISAVAGTLTLHNFPRKAFYRLAGVYSREKATGKIRAVRSDAPSPLITFPGGCDPDNNCYAVGPSDFAAIYNVQPLWNNQVDGTGQTIAIVGESNINIQDVRDYRSFFGLPKNDPQIILDGPDPGLREDETEADLDVEVSGGVARGATIKLVLSETTTTTLGVDLSAQYIVDNNVAPILSESYGICELFIGTTGNQFYNQLWQQAAAEGISAFLASGDQGSAVCDRQEQQAPDPAQFGLQVSGFSSTPYNISVGGTDFSDAFDPTTFWNVTNNPTTQASAKGYIPEVTWNDTCTNAILAQVGFTGTAEQNCNNPQLAALVDTAAGSGGKSGCTSSDGINSSSCSGGYAKPSWQTGPGVPNDNKRDVPDVSLFASNGFEGNFWAICESDVDPGSTSCDPNAGLSEFVGIGGTSASSPAFAGIMAIVEQATGARQGNANYVLYKLAAQNSCASTASPSASCVFYDVQSGTIAVPCLRGSPNCTTNTAGDQFGVLSGYGTTAGYDQATGLGSVNVANLVNAWTNVSLNGTPTTSTLTVTTGNPPQSAPFTITHGTAINVSADVSLTQAEAGTPTGNVALMAATGPTGNESIAAFALAGSSPATAAGTTDLLPGGNYALTAHYPGDATFAASDSAPVSVTVTPEGSKTYANLVTFDNNGFLTSFSASSATYGSGFFLFRVDVGDSNSSLSASTGISSTCSNGKASCPSGTVSLTATPSLGTSSLPLSIGGAAEIQTLPTGNYSVMAKYGGDASYMGSQASVNFSIAKAPTTVTPGVGGVPVQYGATEEVAVGVTTTSNGVAPTGTFTFQLDGAPLNVSALVLEGFPFEPGSSPPSFANLNATGSAVFTSLGTHTISAQYSGDANYAAGSGSSTFTVTQDLPSFGTWGATPASINIGQQTMLVAQLAGSGGGLPPTGTFAFFDGGSAVTGTVTYNQLGNGLSGTLPYTPTTAGTHQITVKYSGDTNYLPTTTPVAANLIVIGPDFTLTASPGSITISAPGGSGTTMITITAQNGFSGMVSFACAGLPAESSCNAAPVNGSGTATLTVMTTAPSMMAPGARPNGVGKPKAKREFLVIALCLIALMLLARRGEQRWITAVALLVLASMAAISACGGGGGGGPTNPGTPPGTTNATVTATGMANGTTINHSIPLTINVQ